MYLRAGLPADTYIKRPPGVIYPFWDQVNESGVGDLSRYMGPIPAQQPGNVRVGKLTWSAVPAGATQYLAVAQSLSDPIEAVSIPAARWRISWAIRLANASATSERCDWSRSMSSMGARATSGVDYHKRRKHRVVHQ